LFESIHSGTAVTVWIEMSQSFTSQ